MRHDPRDLLDVEEQKLLKSENLAVDQQYFQRKILIRKEKITRERELHLAGNQEGLWKRCHTYVEVRALWEEPYLSSGALWS